MPSTLKKERIQEIRNSKSPKQLRETTETLNKEIQKHRDRIDADDYEWRQEDVDKIDTLFDERTHLIERAEFLERIDDGIRDIRQQTENSPEERLRPDPKPGDERKKTGPLNKDQRSDAINWAVARFCGVDALSRDNLDLVSRGKKAGMFRSQRNAMDLQTPNWGNEFRKIQRLLRSGQSIDSLEARDLVIGDGSTSAGLFGTEGFIPLLERNMLYFGPMLQVCNVLTTSDGRDTDMPTFDDTGNEADIVDEAADVSATQDPTIGEITWKTKKLRSKKVKYSAESAEDSVFELFSLLAAALGERLGRGANRYWTLGNAGGEIDGVVPASPVGVTLSAANSADDDQLAQAVVQLYHSIDIAYRTQGGRFMTNDTHCARFSTLKHADGTWMYRFREGMSDTLWGRPISANNHMVSTMGAGDFPLLYGSFNYYWCRLVRSIRIRRFTELHGDNDQDALQAFRRIGGKFVNSGTAAIKKLSIT